MTERIVGIDFGTSTSLIKVKAYRDGEPVDGDPTLAHYVEFDGKNMVSTLIRIAGDEEYYGSEAVSYKPDSVLHRNFKLDLENTDAGIQQTARELTRKFFRFLYSRYNEQSTRFGQFDKECTLVSYPAKWTQDTRDFMIQAAKDAGFQNVQGMDEPTAALRAVMAQESERLVEQGYLTKGKPAYVLLIDMGAGTTDLALCKYTPGGLNHVVATWPPAESDDLFGGREMDELLIRYLVDYLKQCGVPEKMIVNFEKQNLEACKSWKEDTVSATLKREKPVEFCSFVSMLFQMIGETPPPFPVIDRTVLESYCRAYIDRYAKLILEALAIACFEDPDFAPEKLSLAVLTGGHSQWYFAGDILCGPIAGGEGRFGVRLRPEQVISLSQPQGTVSSGLVLSVRADEAEKFVQQKDEKKKSLQEKKEGFAGKEEVGEGSSEAESLYQKANEAYKSDDLPRARLYWRQAAEEGDTRAARELGCSFYHSSRINTKDRMSGLKWLHHSAKKGNTFAQLIYAGILAERTIFDHVHDEESSYRNQVYWLNAALQNMNFQSYEAYKPLVPKIGTHYNDSCVDIFRDYALAEARLGYYYKVGVGTDRNYNKMRYWLERAAEHGSGSAMHILANCYGEGTGYKKDPLMADVYENDAEKAGVKKNQSYYYIDRPELFEDPNNQQLLESISVDSDREFKKYLESCNLRGDKIETLKNHRHCPPLPSLKKEEIIYYCYYDFSFFTDSLTLIYIITNFRIMYNEINPSGWKEFTYEQIGDMEFVDRYKADKLKIILTNGDSIPLPKWERFDKGGRLFRTCQKRYLWKHKLREFAY